MESDIFSPYSWRDAMNSPFFKKLAELVKVSLGHDHNKGLWGGNTPDFQVEGFV